MAELKVSNEEKLTQFMKNNNLDTLMDEIAKNIILETATDEELTRAVQAHFGII
jgi:hypothetical protein